MTTSTTRADVMTLAWQMARAAQWSMRAKSVRPFFAAALKAAWQSVKTRLAYLARTPRMTADQADHAIRMIENKSRMSHADFRQIDELRAA